jgi:hypothetical protein
VLKTAIPPTEKKIRRSSTDLDDAYHEVAANGTLRLISSNAADTAIVYISAIRVD